VTSTNQSMRLSIVIPAYNEANRIRPTLEEYADHFTTLYGADFELVTVLNGCTDGTREVVESLMLQVPQLRLLEFADLSGKGGAIIEGFAAARGELLAFVDADNMVRASETARLVDALERADLSIANRFGGKDLGGGQPLLRRGLSKLLRTWVRFFLSLPFQDTQCGAKAFRASAWQTILPYIREKGWAFDMDVLANAKRQGLNVVEVPVAWRHIVEGSKIRTWEAGLELLLATLRIRFRR
jgi:glycosyltransferase involved in cell wall biosynthesis